MLNLVVTPQARRHIDNIIEYLTPRAGSRVTAEVVSNVYDTMELLRNVPTQGRLSWHQPNVRYRPCSGNARNWLIYWEVMGDDLIVLGVVRAERQRARDQFGDTH